MTSFLGRGGVMSVLYRNIKYVSSYVAFAAENVLGKIFAK